MRKDNYGTQTFFEMKARWSTLALAGAMALLTSVAGLSCTTQSAGTVRVRPGIEVLLADSAHLIDGRRVGILTNQTGVDSRGAGDVEVLLEAGVELTAIFSPEHGFRGHLNEENIGNTTDPATGLPIFSLYGDRLAPTPEMYALIDAMLVDMQDIGARTYTYVSAALHVMET
jgi:uncharacterized protein YbbC (DUF1343 family)